MPPAPGFLILTVLAIWSLFYWKVMGVGEFKLLSYNINCTVSLQNWKILGLWKTKTLGHQEELISSLLFSEIANKNLICILFCQQHDVHCSWWSHLEENRWWSRWSIRAGLPCDWQTVPNTGACLTIRIEYRVGQIRPLSHFQLHRLL